MVLMEINLTRKCCHWCSCCISSLRPVDSTTKELFGCKESNMMESVCRAYCLLLHQVFSLWRLLFHASI